MKSGQNPVPVVIVERRLKTVIAAFLALLGAAAAFVTIFPSWAQSISIAAEKTSAQQLVKGVPLRAESLDASRRLDLLQRASETCVAKRTDAAAHAATSRTLIKSLKAVSADQKAFLAGFPEVNKAFIAAYSAIGDFNSALIDRMTHEMELGKICTVLTMKIAAISPLQHDTLRDAAVRLDKALEITTDSLNQSATRNNGLIEAYWAQYHPGGEDRAQRRIDDLALAWKTLSAADRTTLLDSMLAYLDRLSFISTNHGAAEHSLFDAMSIHDNKRRVSILAEYMLIADADDSLRAAK